MVTTSQALVTTGLVLEGTATFLTIKKLSWGYSKRVMESAKFDYVREKEEKKEGPIILLLLIAGMALQVLSVFI